MEPLAKRVKCHGGFDLLTGLPSRKAEISNTGFCLPILDMTYNSIQNSQKQILVAGDAMLDEYWSGDADRISPEAPVPVVAIAKTEKRLGGAANVALNVAGMSVPCTLASLIGDDANGRWIEAELKRRGVSTLFHPTGLGFPTIQKIRLLARNQQIVRIDLEGGPASEDVDVFTELAAKRVQAGDIGAVIFSDYAKGSLFRVQDLIRTCRERGIPTFVDPKGDSFEKYAGATVVTPNKAELKRVVGAWRTEEELCEKAQALRTALHFEKLLLTRSEEGMTLFDERGAVNFSSDAREVFDVSGAGDTVIAVLASLLLQGMSWDESVRLANKAGGIVVGKLGTAAITRGEVFG